MDKTGVYTQDKRSISFLRAIISYVPIFGIVFALGLTWLFLWSGIWQYVATAGIVLIWAIAWVFSNITYKQNNYQTTVLILSLSTQVLFPLFHLFWFGSAVSAILVIASWLFSLSIVFGGAASSPTRYIVIISCIASTAAIFLAAVYTPFPRTDILNISILRWLIPLLVVLVGSLGLLIVTRTSIAGRLYLRILISFILVVLIPVITISTITTFGSLETDRDYATQNLQNISTQRSNEISLWASKIQVDIFSLPHDPATDQNITSLLYAVDTNQPILNERNTLTQRFEDVLAQTDRLQEIFLMDPAGIVIAATNPDRLYKQYGTQIFFQQGENGLWLSQPIFMDDIGKLSVFVSRPLLSANGQVIGVLTGRTDIQAMSQVVGSRTNLGETGKTLLVSSEGDLLNGVVTGVPTKKITTEIVNAAMATKGTGTLQYEDADGTPVVGTYNWISGLNVILITEMDQSEAFSNVQSVLVTNILVAILAVGISIVGALITARAISNPIGSLVETANQVAKGNLTVRAEVDQQDEIGALGESLNNMTTQIQNLITDLEQRVADRTRDLERRTIEIRTAAQVARDASGARNVDELLNRSAKLIRERFGFYHAGIFLLDEHKEYAVLSAAGGEAGQLMLANKHKLRVGEVGIVGYVAKTGQPRVALDTGGDAVYFRNPLLPYTHSEMALPLKISDDIIGVLDVQSDKINAFDQQDVETLQVMADQIAVAIERTRLLQQYGEVVTSLENSAQEYTGRAWQNYMQHSQDSPGYRYEGIKTELITTAPVGAQEASNTGTTNIKIESSSGKSFLTVPIMLRGRSIGTFHLRLHSKSIPPQTVTLVEEVANRLAMALENARLVKDAQRLASREKQINIITSQVQSSADVEMILQNAIRELGKILGVPKAFIQIGLPTAAVEKNEPHLPG